MNKVTDISERHRDSQMWKAWDAFCAALIGGDLAEAERQRLEVQRLCSDDEEDA